MASQQGAVVQWRECSPSKHELTCWNPTTLLWNWNKL